MPSLASRRHHRCSGSTSTTAPTYTGTMAEWCNACADFISSLRQRHLRKQVQQHVHIRLEGSRLCRFDLEALAALRRRPTMVQVPTEVPTDLPTIAPTEVLTKAPTEVQTKLPAGAPTQRNFQRMRRRRFRRRLRRIFESCQIFVAFSLQA